MRTADVGAQGGAAHAVPEPLLRRRQREVLRRVGGRARHAADDRAGGLTSLGGGGTRDRHHGARDGQHHRSKCAASSGNAVHVGEQQVCTSTAWVNWVLAVTHVVPPSPYLYEYAVSLTGHPSPYTHTAVHRGTDRPTRRHAPPHRLRGRSRRRGVVRNGVGVRPSSRSACHRRARPHVWTTALTASTVCLASSRVP